MAQNLTPTPGEYKRDVGSGDQLPAGEATQANQDLAFGNAVEAKLAADNPVQDQTPTDATPPAAPLPPVQYAQGPEGTYQPKSDMESVLFGPPTGVKPTFDDSPGPVPASLIRSLPSLSAIVQDPSTPPAIKAAFSILVQRIANEMERKYQ